VRTLNLKLVINKTTNGDQWKDGRRVMKIYYLLYRLSVFFSLGVIASIWGLYASCEGPQHSRELGTVSSRLHGVTVQKTERFLVTLAVTSNQMSKAGLKNGRIEKGHLSEIMTKHQPVWMKSYPSIQKFW
jgi:hypothetical protein